MYTFGPNTEETAYISWTLRLNKSSTVNNIFDIIDKCKPPKPPVFKRLGIYNFA